MGKSAALEQVTVNLGSGASSALEQLVALTGDTKTDAINRALQVYAYIEHALRNGGAVLVAVGAGATPQPLRIF